MKRIRKQDEWPCRYSEEGKRTIGRKHPYRTGFAWDHATKPDLVRVQWDGAKEPLTLHRYFIERIS